MRDRFGRPDGAKAPLTWGWAILPYETGTSKGLVNISAKQPVAGQRDVSKLAEIQSLLVN
jgi:hypothetical protein